MLLSFLTSPVADPETGKPSPVEVLGSTQSRVRFERVKVAAKAKQTSVGTNQNATSYLLEATRPRKPRGGGTAGAGGARASRGGRGTSRGSAGGSSSRQRQSTSLSVADESTEGPRGAEEGEDGQEQQQPVGPMESSLPGDGMQIDGPVEYYGEKTAPMNDATTMPSDAAGTADGGNNVGPVQPPSTESSRGTRGTGRRRGRPRGSGRGRGRGRGGSASNGSAPGTAPDAGDAASLLPEIEEFS